MKRRSFIKGLAGIIAAAPAIAQALAAPKFAEEIYGTSEALKVLPEVKTVNERRRSRQPAPGCYIDGIPCTAEQWRDYDNYPHKHSRVMISKPFKVSSKYKSISITFNA